MQTLIRGGTVVTATETRVADLLDLGWEDRLSRGLAWKYKGRAIVDATGKLVMPGGVDPHTHFDLPTFGTVSSDDHYTGHRAAAFGGTTTEWIPSPSINRRFPRVRRRHGA